MTVKPGSWPHDMETSRKGIELIKRFEALRLRAYLCPAGVWTIGWGHTTGVSSGERVSRDTAERYLQDDVSKIDRFLGRSGLKLRQNQYDALSSFIFNIGIHRFLGSTLYRKMLADPDDPSIRNEFMRWTHADGIELSGLVSRRAREADLYFTE